MDDFQCKLELAAHAAHAAHAVPSFRRDFHALLTQNRRRHCRRRPISTLVHQTLANIIRKVEHTHNPREIEALLYAEALKLYFVLRLYDAPQDAQDMLKRTLGTLEQMIGTYVRSLPNSPTPPNSPATASDNNDSDDHHHDTDHERRENAAGAAAGDRSAGGGQFSFLPIEPDVRPPPAGDQNHVLRVAEMPRYRENHLRSAYAVLGVDSPRSVNRRTVNSLYRRMALAVHPDRHPAEPLAALATQRLNAARELVLSTLPTKN